MLLTNARANQLGSVFLNTPVDISGGFTTKFTFTITPHGEGADGLAFVVQNNAATAVGDDGSAIGYGHLTGAFAVEIDTFKNTGVINDPDDNHWAVHMSPSKTEAISASEDVLKKYHSCPDVHFKDGQPHVAVIVVSTTQKTVSVSIDGKCAKVFNDVDIMQGVNAGAQGTAFVGFSAATGRDTHETHSISQWSFSTEQGGGGCLTGFTGDDCVPKVSSGACATRDDCFQCITATSCCAWCADTDSCVTYHAEGGACKKSSFKCEKKKGSVLWWGIGIVIVVLVLCAVALFIYWRRTRVKHRTIDPSLLEQDEHQQQQQQRRGNAESQYHEL
eukprot:TRINITY_DN66127_c2_g2_i1.p1 TRINITY_DN66127_c2_g2~~TRINITY_DN66127_c2_g2_i1.p1  ORF type:complete len:332 (+),score=188.63 TRINITY_DN66127_c2_g2_i1:233-1228(+)